MFVNSYLLFIDNFLLLYITVSEIKKPLGGLIILLRSYDRNVC